MKTKVERAIKKAKRQRILTGANQKIRKGEKVGWMTVGLHFAPANLSGREMCAYRSEGCTEGCLDTAGHGGITDKATGINRVREARIIKTREFNADQGAFLIRLADEIQREAAKAKRSGFRFACRLNLTSDVSWEKLKLPDGRNLMATFPEVQFYDYTKNWPRMLAFLRGELPSNYHLTFSRSESNGLHVRKVMEAGGSIAAVFAGDLPVEWGNRPVISGDADDLRFLDPRGVIVGLTAKGKAKRDRTGFVIIGNLATGKGVAK